MSEDERLKEKERGKAETFSYCYSFIMRWSRFREREREREKERERQKDRCVKKMRKRKTDEMTSSNGTLKRFEKKEMYDISWL